MISKYSIAVLPFVNISSDKENEYFSDGITEEIINALSKLKGIHVTSRTSSFVFKNRSEDIREIGKKLNVALVLEGSIRKSGNVVRIIAQLIKTDEGFHLWSETWERQVQDVFTVQDEIAALISEKINKDLQPDTLNTPSIENAEALDSYLKGSFLQNKWDYQLKNEIIGCFEQAIRLDPNLIQAYIGLSDVYTWLSSTGIIDPKEAFLKNEWCIQQVLTRDQSNPDIHRIMSSKNFWIEWNVPLALKNINIALEGKPSFPDALVQKGLILAASEHIEEALDCMFQSKRLNPIAGTVNYTIGYIYHLMGEQEKALEYINENIKYSQNWDAPYFTKFMALCKIGKYAEAREVIKILSANPNTEQHQYEGYLYACKGESDKAFEYVQMMERNIQENGPSYVVDASFLSQIYLFLNEDEKALDYLNFGLDQRVSPLLFTRIDSTWDRLREHPRFQKALEKIKISDSSYMNQHEKSKKYSKSAISREQAEKIMVKVNDLMVSNEVYLEPSLALSDLAELTETSTNHLSQVLNEFVGKNFYDYVNYYRLQRFLDLYDSPKFRHFTILALAYECGFKSKTTFNAFFRKMMNITPSEYFKQLKKQ